MQDVVDHLRSYIQGWKAYFRLAQTPRVWRELDQWLRHRECQKFCVRGPCDGD
jgi:RNA-directed DNA polymerase